MCVWCVCMCVVCVCVCARVRACVRACKKTVDQKEKIFISNGVSFSQFSYVSNDSVYDTGISGI
jgi:hypothetical protein